MHLKLSLNLLICNFKLLACITKSVAYGNNIQFYQLLFSFLSSFIQCNMRCSLGKHISSHSSPGKSLEGKKKIKIKKNRGKYIWRYEKLQLQKQATKPMEKRPKRVNKG